MTQTYRVLVADPIHEDGRKLLSDRNDLRVDVATGLDEAGLLAKIADYDALIVRSNTRVTRPVIAAAQALKVIGRAGIGVDNINVSAATERGIVVFNTPDANATTTAELTVAHLLSLSRHLPQADRSVRKNEWRPSRFIGTELAGKTIGIIGFGTIGRLVAARCLGLKMRVVAYDPFVTPEIMKESGAEPLDLDAVLATADCVTLHCPLIEKTRNLLDKTRIAAMKPGARIINCARGGLVDEGALFEALTSGHIAGAALDVYVEEPPTGSPLLTLDNIVLTPHLGASTQEAQQAVSIQIAQDIANFLATGAAETAVNLPRITTEQFGRSRPYQELAHSLGRLVGALREEPIDELVVRLFGHVANSQLAADHGRGSCGSARQAPSRRRQSCQRHASRAVARDRGKGIEVRAGAGLLVARRSNRRGRRQGDHCCRHAARRTPAAPRAYRRLRSRGGAKRALSFHPPSGSARSYRGAWRHPGARKYQHLTHECWRRR